MGKQGKSSFQGSTAFSAQKVVHTASGHPSTTVRATLPLFDSAAGDAISFVDIYGYLIADTDTTITATGDGGSVTLHTIPAAGIAAVGDLAHVELKVVFHSADNSGHYYIKTFLEDTPGPGGTHQFQHIGTIVDTTNDYTAQAVVISMSNMINAWKKNR